MDDFSAFLSEMGLTKGQMDAAEALMPSPLPKEYGESYHIGASSIQGMGCFATRDVNGFIGKMKNGDAWYESGRYINHAEEPNAYSVMQGACLMAYGDVKEGHEITMNYRQVRNSMLGDFQ